MGCVVLFTVSVPIGRTYYTRLFICKVSQNRVGRVSLVFSLVGPNLARMRWADNVNKQLIMLQIVPCHDICA